MEASLLAVVRLVLGHKLADNASDVVGILVTDFLVKDLTLREACDLSPVGSTALLELVWSRGLRAAASEKWSLGKLLHTEPHYARWAFTRAMVGAVRRGDLAMVLWLRNRFPDSPIYVEVLGEACKRGQLEALRLLHSFKNGADFEWSSLMLDWAASCGYWDVIHWVHEQNPDVPLDCVLEFALEQNNPEEIEWLIDGTLCDDASIEEAYMPYSEETWPARKDCILYLVAGDLANENVIRGALQTAAEGNDLPFVQWLMRRQVSDPFNTYVFGLAHACKSGHIQVVQRLLSRSNELGLRVNHSTAMRTAAKSGQLALVQWFYELYGRSCLDKRLAFGRSSTALEGAAGNGHLEVVQFLHRIDVALKTDQTKEADTAMCTTSAMDAAAGAGHLAVVQWLHTNCSEGCTTAAMDVAAANGHLDVVKWLHSNRSEGCTSRAMDGVAGREYHDAGCRGEAISCCVGKRPDSFVEEQVAMLDWLKTNRTEGCTSEAVNMASYNENFKVLQWLHANTTARPSSPYPMEIAASAGRLDIVKWLHVTYPECCTEAAMSGAMSNAAENGHLEVVKWVSSNVPGHNPETALASAAGYHQLSPTRRQLEVVQLLLPNCAAADVASALGDAMYEMHFEIMLLLHAQYPALSSEELENAKCKHRFTSMPSHSNYEISQWVEENYPFDTESE